MLERQNVLSTLMLKDVKPSNENVSLQLATSEICQARNLASKIRIGFWKMWQILNVLYENRLKIEKKMEYWYWLSEEMTIFELKQAWFFHIYKVPFQSSSTFQIARFLVAPSVWKCPFDCLSLCHVVLHF